MDDTEELDGANENNLENLHSDTGFSDEVRQLMAEVKDRVAELRQRALMRLLSGKSAPRSPNPAVWWCRRTIGCFARIFADGGQDGTFA